MMRTNQTVADYSFIKDIAFNPMDAKFQIFIDILAFFSFFLVEMVYGLTIKDLHEQYISLFLIAKAFICIIPYCFTLGEGRSFAQKIFFARITMDLGIITLMVFFLKNTMITDISMFIMLTFVTMSEISVMIPAWIIEYNESKIKRTNRVIAYKEPPMIFQVTLPTSIDEEKTLTVELLKKLDNNNEEDDLDNFSRRYDSTLDTMGSFLEPSVDEDES